MKRRFLRIFRLLVLLSIVIAAIAVILVSEGDSTLHINMMIATALGVGFTVLLGTSLMTLAFLSSETGHDDAAASSLDYKEKE
jgi:peptidoglycan/LPS O-acetylase OafA/YrhL